MTMDAKQYYDVQTQMDSAASSASQIKQATDRVEQAKMNTLGSIFNLSVSWEDKKAYMMPFTLMFQAAQYLSAQADLYSLEHPDEERDAAEPQAQSNNGPVTEDTTAAANEENRTPSPLPVPIAAAAP